MLLSRAWTARGEIEREEVAVLVVVFQGLDFLMTELGVLARWIGGLWRRYEEGGGFEGGGVGEASLGRTQERSWRGRAISTASSISVSASRWSSLSSEELLSEDVVQLSSLSSSGARVERMMARGKLGAKEDLKRRLMWFEEREGWMDEDSE